MSYTKGLVFFFLVLISHQVLATPKEINHQANSLETQKALIKNRLWHHRHALSSSNHLLRPVEDTAEFSYVLMSAYDNGVDDVRNLRRIIASNLPEGVKLVILADKRNAEYFKNKYSQWISSDRLIIATDDYTRNGFWARDSFPVPVYLNENKNISLVAADYFREFSAWSSIANSVNASMIKMDFTFVGGNLLSDMDGNCFTVDGPRLFDLNEQDLQYAYGCKEVHILPYLRGIGDVDEVLKPLPGNRMLTNVEDYKASLQEWGYEVIMLPELPGTFRTYANSLVVRDTVFMPVYHVREDKLAQEVYENLGFKVIPIDSRELSDEYYGSVHCQTMAYPEIELKQLFKMLGVREYK